MTMMAMMMMMCDGAFSRTLCKEISLQANFHLFRLFSLLLRAEKSGEGKRDDCTRTEAERKIAIFSSLPSDRPLSS